MSPVLRGGFEVVEVLDPEFLVERSHGLRADTLDARQRRHIDREFRSEFF